MTARELSDRTPVPLKWLVAVAVAAFAAGGGYSLGQARAAGAERAASAVAERLLKAEAKLAEHAESLHDKDKRLALVERAVLSLERIAAGR